MGARGVQAKYALLGHAPWKGGGPAAGLRGGLLEEVPNAPRPHSLGELVLVVTHFRLLRAEFLWPGIPSRVINVPLLKLHNA